jgi:peptide/nickel transport system ATP-binding protein
MYAGELVETGTTKMVFEAPAHPYTRGLLRCIPVPGRTERGSQLGSIPGIVPSLIGELQGCAFRSRCTEASEACAGAIPLRRAEAGAHAFRCIHESGHKAEAEARA